MAISNIRPSPFEVASRGVTPADLATKADKTTTVTGTGLANGGGSLAANRTIDVPIATGAEAAAGTNNTKAVTPLALANPINALDARLDVLETGPGSISKADKVTLMGVSGLVTGGGTLAADRVFTVTQATGAQASAGTLNTVAVTPLALKTPMDAVNLRVDNNETALGLKADKATTLTGTGLVTVSAPGTLAANRTIDVPKATGAEANTGTNDTKAVTPLALATPINALDARIDNLEANQVTFATNAEALAGSVSTKAVSPSTVAYALAQREDDLQNVAKARRDTGLASGSLVFPTQKQRVKYKMVLNTATRNADGTITIPAGEKIDSQAWNAAEDPLAMIPTQNWYGYVVTTTATLGAIQIRSDWNNGVYLFHDYPATVQPSAGNGVYKATWRNDIGIGSPAANFVWHIKNVSAGPVTIYPPELYSTDHSLLPQVIRYDEVVSVQAQPVREYPLWWERWGADRADRHTLEKQTTICADSVTGSNANAGTLYLPKQTLAGLGTLAQAAVVGLYRGGVWRENLPIWTNTPVRGIIVRDIADGSQSKPLPLISALEIAPNGSWINGSDGTWNYTWTMTIGTDGSVPVNDGYNIVQVIEIDTTLEAVTPLAARVRLKNAASLAAAQTAVGSVFLQSLGANQWKANIHPSDGAAPGTRYRYEVGTRWCPINWYQYQRDGLLSGVQLYGAVHGYGMIAGTDRMIADRVLCMHGTAHHLVFGGGTVRRSIFYSNTVSGDPTNATVFYSPDAAGRRWSVSECFYYNVNAPIYCHNSDATNAATYWESAEIYDVVATQGRYDETMLGGAPGGASIKGKATVKRMYIRGYRDPPNFGNQSFPVDNEISDSVFHQCCRIRASGDLHDNIAQLENISGPGVNDRGSILCGIPFSQSYAHHNIMYSKNTATVLGNANAGSDYAATIYTDGGTVLGKSMYNIFVMDNTLHPASGVTIVNQTVTGANTFISDYNVFVHCVGDLISSLKSGNTPQTSWAGYLTLFAPNDSHSLYVDLRDDPRGAKAVFRDPANGDFRWAQTNVAARVKAFCDANGIGPKTVITKWPAVPTLDEAAQLLTKA